MGCNGASLNTPSTPPQHPIHRGSFMRFIIAGLMAGLLFGVGLAVSGMTDPHIVLGFLDVAGDWNPALALVMIGALAVATPGYRLIFKRGRPLWADSFALPTAKIIDWRLMIGAALFGTGWGLSGYCPGPALSALSALWPGTLVFVVATGVGLVVAKGLIPSSFNNVLTRKRPSDAGRARLRPWLRAHRRAGPPSPPDTGTVSLL